MFSFLKKKSSSMLGIDINSTSVNILDVSNTHGQYCVNGYGRITLSQHQNDADFIATRIKELFSSTPFSSRQAVLAVPDSYTINKIVQISSHAQKKDIEEWVLVEAEKYIPYPLDEINLDFNLLGPSSLNPAQLDVQVVASRSENVNQRVEILRRAGIAVLAVDVESFAIERVVRLWSMDMPSNGRHVAVIEIEESYLRCFVFNGDRIIFSREDIFCDTPEAVDNSALQPLRPATCSRDQEILLNTQHSCMEIDRSGSPEQAAGRRRQQDLQKIKRLLQFYPGVIGQIILAGSMAKSPHFESFLQVHLEIPVHVANPFLGMTFLTKELQNRIEQDAFMLMVACGLAIRR